MSAILAPLAVLVPSARAPAARRSAARAQATSRAALPAQHRGACRNGSITAARGPITGGSRGAATAAAFRAPLAAAVAVGTDDDDDDYEEEPFEVDLMVKGMMCEACQESVETALKGVDEVVGVFSDLDSGLTCVQLSPAKVTTLLDAAKLVPNLVKAVVESGFEAEPAVPI